MYILLRFDRPPEKYLKNFMGDKFQNPSSLKNFIKNLCIVINVINFNRENFFCSVLVEKSNVF